MCYLHCALAHPRSLLSQAFTGAAPFNDKMPAAAILAIMRGERPPQPTRLDFTPELQTLMQRCWCQDPWLRPEVTGVQRSARLVSSLLSGDHTPVDPAVCRYPPNPPAWKTLISKTLTTHERVSLITTIFSDRDQVEMVSHLSGGDAQTFVDAIDEVSLSTFLSPKNGEVDPDPNFGTYWSGFG